PPPAPPGAPGAPTPPYAAPPSGPPTSPPTYTPSGQYPAGGTPSGGYATPSGSYPPGGGPTGGFGTGAPPSGGYPASSGTNRTPLFLALGGLAVVALVGILIVALSGGGDDDETTTSSSTTEPTTSTTEETSTTDFTSTTSGGGTTNTTVPADEARELGNLAVSCSEGDMVACDDLWLGTPVGSELERFGATCGDRSDVPMANQCESTYGADGSGYTGTTYTTTPQHNSDISACIDGNMAACDRLYPSTPFDSLPDTLANACGGYVPNGTHSGDCAETYG
ncbi:MAG TPA: hypothetical protein VIL48_23240, partial [Acidimicrobiales bacterium]